MEDDHHNVETINHGDGNDSLDDEDNDDYESQLQTRTE